MSNVQYSYPLDITGTSSVNKVTSEVHTVTAVNNRNYHFLIPVFAPFFAESVKLYKRVGQNLVPLVMGVDWHPALSFMGASFALGKPVYGAISFIDIDFTGEVEITEYQTLGDKYTLDVPTMTEVIANIVFNPRGASWEQITGLQEMFPSVDHPWNFDDLKGQEELIDQMVSIEEAILAAAAGANALQPPMPTKNDIGLSLVQNFGPSNTLTGIAGLSNDTVVTPMVLRAVLDNLGLLNMAETLALFQSHNSNRDNPHMLTKQQIDLGLVENLQVATATDIAGRRKVRRYVTLDGLIDYISMYGCKPCEEKDEVYAPADSLLKSYCDGVKKMGVYANGTGGSYEKVMEVNSADCGYLPPAPLPAHPPQGTVLNYYCVAGDRYATYADGYGGSFTRLLQVNSTDCGYTGAPPTGPTNPAAGTLLSQRCEGTTLVKVLANGTGGSYDQRTENSSQCTTTSYPPNGQLISTFCAGTTLKGTYANGTGGTYEGVVEMNSAGCGYTAPTPAPTAAPPSANRAINISINKSSLTLNNQATLSFNCTGLTVGTPFKVEIRRNPSGGVIGGTEPDIRATLSFTPTATTYSGSYAITFSSASEVDDWAYQAYLQNSSGTTLVQSNVSYIEFLGTGIAPTPAYVAPAATITFDQSTLAVGQRTTIRTQFTNLIVGNKYRMQWARKGANQTQFYYYGDNLQFTADATSKLVTFNMDNNGDMANGTALFKVWIFSSTVTWTDGESPTTPLTYTSDKGISLTMNGVTSQQNVRVGQNVDVRGVFKNFPITGSPAVNGGGIKKITLRITGADQRDVVFDQKFATDSTGGYLSAFSNTLLATDTIRGLVTYQWIAYWDEFWSNTNTEPFIERTTVSNSVTINWIS